MIVELDQLLFTFGKAVITGQSLIDFSVIIVVTLCAAYALRKWLLKVFD